MKLLHQETLKRSIHYLYFSLILVILSGFITYLINPDIYKMLDALDNVFSDTTVEEVTLSKVWYYIQNNGIIIPLQMLIFACIPIPFIYMFNIILTNILFGFVLALALRNKPSEFISLFISSIPHYVVEIFAYGLFAAVLFELNKVIRKKIKKFFKREKEKVFFFQKFKYVIRIYIIVFVLMVIAGFLETYVTNIIMHLFS